jgi:hypothetical protein
MVVVEQMGDEPENDREDAVGLDPFGYPETRA